MNRTIQTLLNAMSYGTLPRATIKSSKKKQSKEDMLYMKSKAQAKRDRRNAKRAHEFHGISDETTVWRYSTDGSLIHEDDFNTNPADENYDYHYADMSIDLDYDAVHKALCKAGHSYLI